MTSPDRDILGYTFRDNELLRRAVTHPSWLNESRGEVEGDYQRLEFLGDAVLGLCLADLISERFPDLPEGDLSRIRASLADQPKLAEIAASVGLGSILLLGKGEEKDGGRAKPSILSDALEAVIGAIFRDGGFFCAREVVERLYSDFLQQHDASSLNDPKSELQEWLAARRLSAPEYELVAEEGPPHDRRFCVSVSVQGEVAGEGEGRSKKAAQQVAARKALAHLVDKER